MKRYQCFVVVCLLVAATCVAQAATTDDEKAIEQIEREALSHSNLTDSDLAWWKPHIPEHGVFIDPLGHAYSFTAEEYEPMMRSMAKADPNVKNTVEVESVEVHMSGDTAYLTVKQTASSTGHKDKRFNYHGKYQVLDVWQKHDGEWKNLATAIVSTEPIPAKDYKLPPLPGTEPASKDK